MQLSEPAVAVIVPCYNEALAIQKVVTDLKAALPTATIYVYDNNSSDDTARVAAAAGAIVRTETRRGKGNVVRRAFADVDADIYVLIDGDDTYDTAALPAMVQTLLDGPFDHVLGVRQETTASAYRPGHALGNRAFNALVSRLFGAPVSDMLSGYRVFSRRFVKSFPALSKEFEIETELTVHSMTLRVPQVEVAVGFRDRAEGSESKLRTYHDGFRILSLIGRLVRHERPLFFYNTIATLFILVAVALAIPVFVDFFNTGLVPRLPTAVLSGILVVIGLLSVSTGVVLDGVLRMRQESARLSYLRLDPPATRTRR